MGMPGHHYDASAEVTLQGTVTEVKEVDCQMCGAGMGTHLVLKTEAESMEVLLGPKAFLNERGFTVAKGDKLEVTGAKTKIDDHDQLLAREVKKGDTVLTSYTSPPSSREMPEPPEGEGKSTPATGWHWWQPSSTNALLPLSGSPVSGKRNPAAECLPSQPVTIASDNRYMNKTGDFNHILPIFAKPLNRPAARHSAVR